MAGSDGGGSEMTKFSVVAQNLNSVNPKLANDKYMRGRKQMCWKCQCDKNLLGGSMRFLGADRSTRIFICKEWDCAVIVFKPNSASMVLRYEMKTIRQDNKQ